MAAVDELINATQKAYDAKVEQIDREAESVKMIAREKAVESIINKFR